MPPRQVGRRYRVDRILADQPGRSTLLAVDALTGREVVVKSGPTASLIHELAITLTVPPGVGAAVLDAGGAADGHSYFVMERLRGETLAAAAPHLDPHAAPALLQAAAQCLAHLHRSGTFHMDVKPSNLILLAGSPIPALRLLDFGFSRRASGALSADDENAGGTPAFMAPEVIRGWTFDHRADQFALGVTWRQLFPDLDRDPAWTQILDRMCARVPAQRFQSLIALRDEVAARFDLAPRPDRFPSLGGGPLRGREGDLRACLDHFEHGGRPAHILLCGIPGTGLTRFLLEVQSAIARDQGSAAQLVDWGDPEAIVAPARFLAFLEECEATGERILSGVPDPSPGFRWLPEALAGGLRRRLRRNARRLVLEPIGPEAFTEIVALGLGTGGRLAGELGRTLRVVSGGSLRVAADGFLEALGRLTAGETDLVWHESEGDARSLSLGRPLGAQPAFDGVPARLREPLAICARAGLALPRTTARELITAFADPAAFDDLLDHGYLQPESDDRLGFVTPMLHAWTVEMPIPRESEVVAWLNAHWAPDCERPEEVLAACARARRCGDREREARHFAAALTRAIERRRWHHTRRLVEGFDGPGGTADADRLRERVIAIAALLGPTWRVPRLLYEVAFAFNPVSPEVSLPILQELAEGADSEAAWQSLVTVLSRAQARQDPAGFAKWFARLKALSQASPEVPAGLVVWMEARQLFFAGERSKAEPLVREAMQRFRPHWPVYENLCLQLLAILRFSKDAREGLSILESALASAPDDEVRAQIHTNLCLMHTHRGDFEAALAAAERGIAVLGGNAETNHLPLLRLRRAWACMHLDRCEEALAEAHALLELSTVQQNPTWSVLTRMLAGQAMLQRQNTPRAIAAFAQAWSQARSGGQPALPVTTLRFLMEAILDLEAWDLAAAHGETMRAGITRQDAAAVVTAARIDALCAQADGRPDDACRLLNDGEAHVPELTVASERARFFHHLGAAHLADAIARVDTSAAQEAARRFAHAAELLPPPGSGYWRGRARLARVRALHAAGASRAAHTELEDVIALARGIDARGLLADALRTRATLALDGEESTA
jgi:tetratricopeptide (TPR) repeat protein